MPCGGAKEAESESRELLGNRRYNLDSLNKARLWNSRNLSAPDKMSVEIKKEIELEIAHVLFIDIVGYSKLSINQQHAAVEELNEIVRASEQFQELKPRPLDQNPDWRRHGAGFLHQSGSADAMRGGNQPRSQGASGTTTSDGHPQRAGERRDRRKWTRQSRWRWHQHGTASDGLRRRRAHSPLQARR